MVKKTNIVKTMTLDKKNVERFHKQFPITMGKFVDRCIEKALKDKDFAENIFYNRLDLIFSIKDYHDLPEDNLEKKLKLWQKKTNAELLELMKDYSDACFEEEKEESL